MNTQNKNKNFSEIMIFHNFKLCELARIENAGAQARWQNRSGKRNGTELQTVCNADSKSYDAFQF